MQFFDLSATTLSNIGLLYITVSVYQMLRGAVILWNTLFGTSPTPVSPLPASCLAGSAH